ncbi:MAG: hypothetical protein L6Q77_10220 [Bacteroidetes bacterium]|nr:hypothetical protein [Bacteroidota bacterium]
MNYLFSLFVILMSLVSCVTNSQDEDPVPLTIFTLSSVNSLQAPLISVSVDHPEYDSVITESGTSGSLILSDRNTRYELKLSSRITRVTGYERKSTGLILTETGSIRETKTGLELIPEGGKGAARSAKWAGDRILLDLKPEKAHTGWPGGRAQILFD